MRVVERGPARDFDVVDDDGARVYVVYDEEAVDDGELVCGAWGEREFSAEDRLVAVDVVECGDTVCGGEVYGKDLVVEDDEVDVCGGDYGGGCGLDVDKLEFRELEDPVWLEEDGLEGCSPLVCGEEDDFCDVGVCVPVDGE